jgi:ABC-type sugar transport system substrate-binding protein
MAGHFCHCPPTQELLDLAPSPTSLPTLLLNHMNNLARFTSLACPAFVLAAALLLTGCGQKSEAPVSTGTAAVGKKITVGFAQTGAESEWRKANTVSMKTEAEKRSINLKFVDGQGKHENQIAAVRSFIAQKVDVILIAPTQKAGWEPVLTDAKAAKIPVVLMDRNVEVADQSLYAAFVGSDFYEEGRMAVEWLVKNAGGRTAIVELQGTTGSDPATDRKKAFADGLAKHPEFKMLDSQTGNFSRAEGKTVMEALLKKHGKAIQILYAHNDDMALGAIQAIEEAGLKPGKDILIVTIDAIKEAIKAVVDGKINCTVECNPLFGPKIYDTVEKILKGESVPKTSSNKDQLFDSTNAAAALPTRQY